MSFDFALQQLHKYEPNSTIRTVTELKQNLTFTTYLDFLHKWEWMTHYIRSLEDYSALTKDVLHILEDHGVDYAELMFDLRSYGNSSLSPVDLSEAILGSAADFMFLHRIRCNFIASFSRSTEHETVEEKVHTLLALYSNGMNNSGFMPRLAGIGASGAEALGENKALAPLYTKAAALGYNTTIHTGEDNTDESVACMWEALQNLPLNRIGHGVQSYRDERLMLYLAKTKMPIESCPTSNIKTQVISPPLSNHPILEFYRRGMLLTVNDDDPLYFGVYVDQQVALLLNTTFTRPGLGGGVFSEEDIALMRCNSVKVSFMFPGERLYLLEKYGCNGYEE